MPRLQHSLLHRAHTNSPHLRTLLPACRDLESAQHELRWIREHVSSLRPASASALKTSPRAQVSHERRIAHLCSRRGHGEPLQYVLGSQPFGGLDLKCRRGVLIPRPETEAYVMHVAGLIRKGAFGDLTPESGFRILDLCTGTGCIALLLYEQLHKKFPGIQVTGLDISPTAVQLARRNLRQNVQAGMLPGKALGEGRVTFEEADVFKDGIYRHVPEGIDMLISNPPYISSRGFNTDTGRSVRNFEPKVALVPDEKLQATATSLDCDLEDVFYARLITVASVLKPKIMLFEVGDMKQAERVAKLATTLGSSDDFGYEIWRDEPDGGDSELGTHGSGFITRGEGHGRSVLVYRKSWGLVSHKV
ncbi:putative Release factor glutamine methyltransferase N-terminal domain-containing protein [Seiridium unicorne]|uniref:Release factor glutamine methyltransferase N-terminal domain-containing protein n=1 Tax=Seiridium unicorne TaxID=138068 RepID=A0ABR2V091_9PEZI